MQKMSSTLFKKVVPPKICDAFLPQCLEVCGHSASLLDLWRFGLNFGRWCGGPRFAHRRGYNRPNGEEPIISIHFLPAQNRYISLLWLNFFAVQVTGCDDLGSTPEKLPSICFRFFGGLICVGALRSRE